MKIVHAFIAFYKLTCVWAGRTILSLFLLAIRLTWGYQFFIAGSGKLKDISRPIGYFRDLHIPFPVANAWLVACVECFGGLLLMLGIGSRAVAFALTINMIVAYLAPQDDRQVVFNLFQNADFDAVKAFMNSAPFFFLLTAVFVLALGPGWFSVDGILKPFLWKKGGSCCMKVSKGTVPVITTEVVPRG